MNVDEVIKNRRTKKILSEHSFEAKPIKYNTILDELLDLAAYAPYHYMRNNIYDEKALNSKLPYRFYVLDATKCRETKNYIVENKIEAGKINNMLNVASALVMVTWLPEPSTVNKDGNKKEVAFEGNLVNMEHIAAASAAIQNVLLGATARNIPNYWSTGGKLRSKTLKEYLSIPLDEIIAGAIFLYPKLSENENIKIFDGKLREQGKEKSTWIKWI